MDATTIELYLCMEKVHWIHTFIIWVMSQHYYGKAYLNFHALLKYIFFITVTMPEHAHRRLLSGR